MDIRSLVALLGEHGCLMLNYQSQCLHLLGVYIPRSDCPGLAGVFNVKAPTYTYHNTSVALGMDTVVFRELLQTLHTYSPVLCTVLRQTHTFTI